MRDASDIEKRLHNAECMLMALVHAVKDVLPPDAQQAVAERQAGWFEASRGLGAFDIPELKKPTEH